MVDLTLKFTQIYIQTNKLICGLFVIVILRHALLHNQISEYTLQVI